MLRACDAERQPRKCSETSGPRAPLAPPLLNMETAKAAVPFRSLATSASQPGAPAVRNGSRSCWSCFEPVRAWVVSSQRCVVSQRRNRFVWLSKAKRRPVRPESCESVTHTGSNTHKSHSSEIASEQHALDELFQADVLLRKGERRRDRIRSQTRAHRAK